MDAFFASVEQGDNPHLQGKPVIVGGLPDTRGVVAACSYEARQFGIHSAMSSKKAFQLCPKAIFVRPRMHRYKEISQIVMEIFSQYTNTIEPLSVDEAFLDVTSQLAPSGSATLLAQEICAEIFCKTKLTASAGVSFNKFLAKVASNINKPNGISTITPKQAIAFIATLPIEKFYGVGQVTKEKMHLMGIHKGKDLAQYSKEILEQRFGKAGTFFYNISKGIDDRPVQNNRTRKSYGKETTLDEDTHCIEKIKDIFTTLINELGEVLERSNKGAYSITVKIKYHDFSTITRSISLQRPIRNKNNLMEAVPRALGHCNFSDKAIRLIGISVAKLINLDESPWQQPLPFMEKNQHSPLTLQFHL